MTLMSDKWIRVMSDKHGMIEPYEGGIIRYDKSQSIMSYGTSSYGYDVRCVNKFKLFTNMAAQILDPKNFDPTGFVDVVADSCIIPPGGFALTHSLEYLRIPRDVLGLVVGKTSYARCGLLIQTSPLEPAWQGNVTLSLSNTSPLPVKVYANEGIAQILFFRGEEVSDTDYTSRHGRYQGQRGLVLPK